MSCNAVSVPCTPWPGAQGVSPVCVARTVLLSLGFFFLQSSCLQKFSFPIVGSNMCGGLLVKQDLPLLLPELNSGKMHKSGDVVLAEFAQVFQGRDLQCQD